LPHPDNSPLTTSPDLGTVARVAAGPAVSMLPNPQPARRIAVKARSLKQEYEEFLLQRIEEFKDQLARDELLAIADEAVRELEMGPEDQLVLTEVLVLEHVDRLITRRLNLPSYRRWRDRHVERTALATRVAAVELVLLAILVAGAAMLAEDGSWWIPAVVAVPMLVLALWYDMRSRSRRLVPELTGSIAIASVAAMGAVAGGEAWPLATGLWLVLGARILTSIPHVRHEIGRLHGRAASRGEPTVGDVAAIAVAAAAVVMDGSLLLGSVAILGVIVVQRIAAARPPVRARLLGARQMALGLAVVAATAAGTWLA